MPQGDKKSNELQFFDATYDGHWDGELQRGLGQLTDGRTGHDNFKMHNGRGWVGWKSDSRAKQPVDIKFEFDEVREFSDVNVYCNNQFSRDVEVNITYHNFIWFNLIIICFLWNKKKKVKKQIIAIQF